MFRSFACALALMVCVGSAQAGERALQGGLLGAGAGALIGGLATGRAGGAVAGAVVGGAAGAIIGNESDRRHKYRRYERAGVYFNKRGRCFYQYPNGRVTKVSNAPCGY